MAEESWNPYSTYLAEPDTVYASWRRFLPDERNDKDSLCNICRRIDFWQLLKPQMARKFREEVIDFGFHQDVRE